VNGSRPPLFVQGSIALHLFAAGTVTTQPSLWPMALAAVVADHAAITAAGLWPTSSLLGPNIRTLPAASIARRELALTIDDGPDPEVTPRVLDLLDEHGIRATFFCIGERVSRHASLAREIVARGHAIENHSHRHRHDFSLLGPRAFDRELDAAQRAIGDTIGTLPRFFRAPAGLRNVFLQGALERHGLRLASWTRRGFDTVRRDPARVARRLTAGLAAGDILLLHDGHAARTARGNPVIAEALPLVARAIAERGLRPVSLVAAFESA
jgi:peptidoglycan/xylan/chitin deacetylase (PgdA/CDA1 family)